MFNPVPNQPNLSTGGNNLPPDPTAAARRVAQETMYGSRTGTAAFGAQTRPVSDPNCKLVGHEMGFQDTGRLCLGYIMDGSAIANCYRVHLEKAHAPITAVPLSGTGNTVLGATEINSYPPGTPVIVMVHEKANIGYIIGAVPNILQTGQSAYHDYISQASRKRVDDCHKKYLKMHQCGQMVDASGWRPFDQTLAGEWGAITMTGCKVTLDDFMVQASVNEMCGIWGFYHDSLLRIAGYNLQMWTGANEHEIYVDQSETYDFQGFSPYAWEGNGFTENSGPGVREFDPEQYQCGQGCPWYAHWENENDYMQGFHRTQLWHGYLGQGRRLLVQVPPKGKLPNLESSGDTVTPPPAYESTIETEDGGGGGCGSCSPPTKQPPTPPTPPALLHEDNIALDGRRFIASSKGIVIAKRMLLSPSIRRRRPDAPDGDDADTNYKTASKFGKGEDHPITGDIRAEDTHKNLQRASGVLDLHAYLFNYAGLHPFYWHRYDFKTWEQDELEYAEYQHKVPNFTELMSSMYLREPEPKTLEIDHRYNKDGKKQNFYETTSAITLLEDGGIVISDGYGAEIKMSGGCLFLTAPGDVWMKSGRHCQMWSGGDGIIRANGNVDVSTTEKHVRIKSEKNVLILAGNNSKGGSDGGVLIESRSKLITYDFEQPGDEIRFGGVVLRAPDSNVAGLAHQIYLRSGGGDSSFEPGNITIDAGKGEKDIVTKSNRIFNYVGENGAISNFFSLADAGDPQVAHYFSKDFVLLSGTTGIQDNIIAGKGIISRDFVLCDGPLVGDAIAFPCEGECEKDINEACDKIVEYIYQLLPAVANKFHDEYLAKLWYEEKRAGHGPTMDIMEFSWRTDEQYKIPDFMLYEDRWQQLARLAGKIPNTWTESAVKSKVAGETYPFPGKKWLTQAPVYRTQDFNLVEQAGDGLRDKKRGECPNLASEYKDPSFAQSTPKIINGTYPIVFQP